jgi:pSer/pThr/pTyr-binding forkhead associated (FHA) protein
MRTESIRPQTLPAPETPILEQYPEDGSAPLRTPIASMPFSIGRDDDADLRIDSRRVSRRHAVINCEGGVYSIDDLDSTNGTFVNGERVSEAILQSGDILAFGDAEFTFNAPLAARTGSMVTQLMDSSPWREPESAADDTIYLVRRMHAVLMNRCLRVRFEPIVRLDQGGLFGHEMIDGLSAAPTHLAGEHRRLMQIDCQLTARLRQLQRMIAAEEAGEFSAGAHVFLPVAGSEIGSQRLIESLVDLSHIAPPNKRLVIVVPHDNVSNSAYMSQFYDQTRDLGLGMAYGECAAAHVTAEGKDAHRPDFVKLARSLTRAIHRVPGQQRRVEAIVQDARNAGCQIIAAGVSCGEEAACCRELGCQFGQGSFYADFPDASSIPSVDGQAVHA